MIGQVLAAVEAMGRIFEELQPFETAYSSAAICELLRRLRVQVITPWQLRLSIDAV